MKRSSCASGSGYVPSCSIGFCVASTKNGSGSVCVCPADRHRALLHRLQQRRLRLRRGAVDLVGQHDVREDRARARTGRRGARSRVLLQHLGAGDVARHQVGRELDAREREVERLRDRLHEQRLGETRHADEQRVAAGEQRGDQVVDDLVLADDAAARSASGARAAPGRALEQLEVVASRLRGRADGHAVRGKRRRSRRSRRRVSQYCGAERRMSRGRRETDARDAALGNADAGTVLPRAVAPRTASTAA